MPKTATEQCGTIRGMTLDQFVALCDDTAIKIDGAAIPDSQLLLSLWHDRRGHWVVAHEIAQSIPTEQGSALHAYLHREEGDISNAQYWYGRAGRRMPDSSLEDEWTALSREFLGDS